LLCKGQRDFIFLFPSGGIFQRPSGEEIIIFYPKGKQILFFNSPPGGFFSALRAKSIIFYPKGNRFYLLIPLREGFRRLSGEESIIFYPKGKEIFNSPLRRFF
jgi:hypothetical protein